MCITSTRREVLQSLIAGGRFCDYWRTITGGGTCPQDDSFAQQPSSSSPVGIFSGILPVATIRTKCT